MAYAPTMRVTHGTGVRTPTGKPIECGGPLRVNQASTFTGNATFEGTLAVTGAQTFTGATSFAALVTVAAGITFSGATGANDLNLTDNLADAASFQEGSNVYLRFVTTDSSEAVQAHQRLTTTDGVASGTARVVGGTAYAAISASDNLLASAGGSAHVDHAQTYSIPANTIKAGSRVRIRAMVRVTNASGTDTLETKLYIGGTTLVTTTAFDPDAAEDFVQIEFELIGRAAPGAAASCVGAGRWVTSDGGSLVHGAAILAPTNLATNGALIVKVSSKWSATTADTNARLEILTVEIE